MKNHTSPIALLCLALVSLLALSGAHAAYPPKVTPESIKQDLARADYEHPVLLATKAELDALKQSLAHDPFKRRLADAILAQAEATLAVDPVERTFVGRRLLRQSRHCLRRVLTLGFAYHISGDTRFAARCETELLAAADFSDWSPLHFLDVAEMSAALAYGYDLFYHELSEESRQKIRTALVEKGLLAAINTKKRHWVKSTNNWGQVCYGGLILAALVTKDHDLEIAAQTIHHAITHLPYSMAAFAPDGAYPEGPGYWSYGTTYNVVLIEALENALGTDYGLSNAPGFDKTGAFLALATGTSSQAFNYADGKPARAPEPAQAWFAQRYDRPDWSFGERKYWIQTLEAMEAGQDESRMKRYLPLGLLWAPANVAPSEVKMPLHWKGDGISPIALHRSSWQDPDAVFLGVKAGSPAGPHGHMDAGSFVLDSHGVRWAVDLGPERYHNIEKRGMNLWKRDQESDRWTIFKLNNLSHNTLVINGALQTAAGRSDIIRFSDDAARPYSIVDLSPVYQNQVSVAHRGFTLLPTNEVVIRDELSGLQAGDAVRWGMLTRASITEENGPQLLLEQEDKALKLHAVTDAEITWENVDTEQPRNEWDGVNKNTRMAAFTQKARESGSLSFAVIIVPGGAQPSEQAIATAQTKLADW